MNTALPQLVISSAVTLMVAVVGIVSTCVAARSAAKCEMQKAIVLRFVDMFETAIQGLSEVLDVYASLQTLFATPMDKKALAVRLVTMIGLSNACTEKAKVADPAILRLNIYFPNPGHDTFDSRKATSAMLNLIALAVEIDRQMKADGRLETTDNEYVRYQALEQIAAIETRPLQMYYNERCEYFIRRYAEWSRKNLPFLKGL